MDTQSDFYLDVPRAASLSRGLIFIKWLLVVPHSIILYFYGLLAGLAGIVAWFSILFTGTYPADLWNFSYGYVRWSTRVSAYTSLLRDEYPPFGDGPYPVELSLRRREDQSRGLLFVRWIAVFPLAVWLALIGLLAAFGLIVAWFAILINGAIPQNLHGFLVGFLRYGTRVNCYITLLTDEWPGFSFDA